jgi:hypothetical protein
MSDKTFKVSKVGDKTAKDFCTDKTSSNPCGPEVDTNKSARDTCKEVKTKAQAMADAVKSTTDNLASITPFGALTQIFGTKQKMTQDTRNSIQIVQDNYSTSESENKCKNVITATQKNILDNTECLKVYADAKWGPPDFTYKDIHMKNTTTNVNQCQMAAVAAQLSKMGASADNSAILEAVQSVAGGGSQEIDQKSCNNISEEQTSCQYLSQKNCCMNNVNSSQDNVLKACGNTENVTMDNTALNTSVCAGEITTSQATDLSADAKNTSEVKASQVAVGAVVILILVGGAVAAYKVYAKGNKCKGKEGQAYKDCLAAGNKEIELKGEASAGNIAAVGNVAAKLRGGRSTYASKLWRKYKLLFILAGAIFVIHITKKK